MTNQHNPKPVFTLYDIIGVKPEADNEVVKAACYALLKKHHPDHGGNPDLCSRINEALETLTNPGKRETYNKELKENCKNVIGSYKLIRKIAEGGFGEVYEAEHILLKKKACIKRNLNISTLDTEIFLKEAGALWDLRHHALGCVKEMFMLPDGSCALVMNYIEGPTLMQTVEHFQEKKEKIDPESMCWIMERVLDALRYVHYHGVVHGDIKPQNIIIQPEEHTCALVDFGLAAVNPTSSSKAIGYTKHFASPEALARQPLLPESDLYSLGLTMIYALGGDPRTKKVPSSVPEKIRDFLGELIVYDVTKRPNWEKYDLVKKLRGVRLEVFGREHTDFKKLWDYSAETKKK